MKKNLATIIIVFFALTLCFSQDTITKKTGEIIKAKVSEVGVTEIKYKLFDNQNGPTYIMLKTELSAIKYENGNRDVFDEVNTNYGYNEFKPPYITYSDNCTRGQADAQLYHGKQGIWFLSGFLFGGIGIVGAALSSPSPSSNTLIMSKNQDVFDNAVYLKCYEKKARKKNVVNATLGLVPWILLLLVYNE